MIRETSGLVSDHPFSSTKNVDNWNLGSWRILPRCCPRREKKAKKCRPPPRDVVLLPALPDSRVACDNFLHNADNSPSHVRKDGCQGHQGGTVVQWEYCGGTVGTRVRLTCGEGDISRVWFSIPFAARERLRPEISQAGGITTSCWGRRNIKIYIWVPIYGTLPSETIFLCCVFLISPLEAGPRRQGSITGCFPWR